ncbi:MAG: archease [Candidatus Micrarchaeia archaeon]
MKYRYLPHTADVEFEAYGKTFKEAIENAAEAMLNVMLDLKKVKAEKAQKKQVEINESAGSKEDLLWYTLQDILTKTDEKALHAYALKVKQIEQKGSRLRLQGKLFYKKADRDLSLLEIKAVTPYELSVEKKKQWIVRVVVDV